MIYLKTALNNIANSTQFPKLKEEAFLLRLGKRLYYSTIAALENCSPMLQNSSNDGMIKWRKYWLPKTDAQLLSVKDEWLWQCKAWWCSWHVGRQEGDFASLRLDLSLPARGCPTQRRIGVGNHFHLCVENRLGCPV